MVVVHGESGLLRASVTGTGRFSPSNGLKFETGLFPSHSETEILELENQDMVMIMSRI
jgi:hypothetical protein